MCELGIDKLSFDDFSLDVDAMVTAALRMFMELGMVQKFKIDYEVHTCLHFLSHEQECCCTECQQSCDLTVSLLYSNLLRSNKIKVNY